MNPRRSFEGARCLVTGASSGLGRAIAGQLARRGASVLLTGRSLDRLRATARGLVEGGVELDSLMLVDADLTEDEGRGKVIHAAHRRFGALDLAVNCAGVGVSGDFGAHAPDVLREVFEINVVALVELTRALLPLLKLGKRPSLVNFGATEARRGHPGRAEYSASRFAVAGFTEAIRAEWSPFAIHVLLVNPGPTATDSEDNRLAETTPDPAPRPRQVTADRVATRTLEAIRRRRPELTIGTEGRLLLLANRVAPALADLAIARRPGRAAVNNPASPIATGPSPQG